MKHYYAIDLESWVYPDLEEFRNMSQDERKRLDNGYIVESTNRLLNLLEKNNTHLTFFVVGELYEWYPDLIRKIKKAGHEIAYHTHTHILLKNKDLVEKQLEFSRKFLDEFKPTGFQAPMIHFTYDSYPLLKKYGFSYSSSVYHSDISHQSVSDVTEIPVSSIKYFGKSKSISWPRPMNFTRLLNEFPFGSSYFVGMLGAYGISRFLKIYEERNKSAVLFIHNWQIFPPQKASYPNLRFLLKHPLYLPYLRHVKGDFETLLKNFKFDKLENYTK